MASLLDKIQALVNRGEVRISLHGYRELAADGILANEIVAGISEVVLVEEYPLFAKGPCVLVLQRDVEQRPIHVVWGIPKGHEGPAVLVTAYRPDPKKWQADFVRRRKI